MHRRDAAALVLPAHTMKAEARQFGAEPLGDAGRGDRGCRPPRGRDAASFPTISCRRSPSCGRSTAQTIEALEEETNPLAVRRPAFGRGPSNQEFGRL